MWTRRSIVKSLPAMALLPQTLPARAFLTRGSLLVGTGTSSPSASKGIYAAEWDHQAGTLGALGLVAEVASPTYLAMTPRGLAGRHTALVYAISESDTGMVTAFDLTIKTPGDGVQLTKLNAQSTEGAGPAHVAVVGGGVMPKAQGSVYVANYGGGSLTSYAIEANGALSAPVSHFQYAPVDGDAIHAKPHAHEATPSPDRRFLLVNDLGSDRIWVYRMDAVTGTLVANEPAFWQGRHGAGPRHLVFHPNGRWVYNVNELDSTVDALAWDAKAGTLTTMGGPVSTLEAGYPKGKAFPSGIVVSKDGRFVYVGNRRNETIAMLPVNAQDGSLTLVQVFVHGGKTAREIVLDPTEKFLLVACQDSNGIVVLVRDGATGKLSATGHTYAIDSPQCLVFTR